jgi:hypothetical protein
VALLAWQAPERNEWYREIDQAVGGACARGARMLSLAGQHTTAGILAAAGFTGVAFTDVREPVYYGADSAQAYDFVTGLQATKDMLASLDPAAVQDALRGLRGTLAGHATRDGVLFGARTWIITARTPRRPRGRAPDIEEPGRIGHERGNLGPRRTPSDASRLAARSATMSDPERPSRQNPARQIDPLRRGSSGSPLTRPSPRRTWRRCAPYLRPGSVTHREQKRPGDPQV